MRIQEEAAHRYADMLRGLAEGGGLDLGADEPALVVMSSMVQSDKLELSLRANPSDRHDQIRGMLS